MSGTFLAGTAVFLLANLALGLVRIVRGPGAADRMLAGQLLVTTGVAVLLVLGAAQQQPQLWNVALVFAVVAAVATVSFVRWDALGAAGAGAASAPQRPEPPNRPEGPDGPEERA